MTCSFETLLFISSCPSLLNRASGCANIIWTSPITNFALGSFGDLLLLLLVFACSTICLSQAILKEKFKKATQRSVFQAIDIHFDKVELIIATSSKIHARGLLLVHFDPSCLFGMTKVDVKR